MPFAYTRTIHFPDTDAAGVVFFARYLFLCHEAYEEALASAGLPIGTLFSPTGVMLPVSRSTVDYLRPFVVGDRVRVTVTPEPLTENTFAVSFELWRLGPVEKLAARARTEHVCIDARTRERRPLAPALAAWISAPSA